MCATHTDSHKCEYKPPANPMNTLLSFTFSREHAFLNSRLAELENHFAQSVQRNATAKDATDKLEKDAIALQGKLAALEDRASSFNDLRSDLSGLSSKVLELDKRFHDQKATLENVKTTVQNISNVNSAPTMKDQEVWHPSTDLAAYQRTIETARQPFLSNTGVNVEAATRDQSSRVIEQVNEVTKRTWELENEVENVKCLLKSASRFFDSIESSSRSVRSETRDTDMLCQIQGRPKDTVGCMGGQAQEGCIMFDNNSVLDAGGRRCALPDTENQYDLRQATLSAENQGRSSNIAIVDTTTSIIEVLAPNDPTALDAQIVPNDPKPYERTEAGADKSHAADDTNQPPSGLALQAQHDNTEVALDIAEPKCKSLQKQHGRVRERNTAIPPTTRVTRSQVKQGQKKTEAKQRDVLDPKVKPLIAAKTNPSRAGDTEAKNKKRKRY